MLMYCVWIIVVNNILNVLFMILLVVMVMGLIKVGVDILGLFFVIVLLNVVVVMYIYLFVFEFLLCFVVWVFVYMFYWICFVYVEWILVEGVVVFVCNYVSYVDVFVLVVVSLWLICFVMDYWIFKMCFVSWVFWYVKVILIVLCYEDFVMFVWVYDLCEVVLKDGEFVCIFFEGKLMKMGDINMFYYGIIEILSCMLVLVILMVLCGLWGSYFL